MSYIATFNPYTMSDDTILAVATNREKLLGNVLKVLKNNLLSKSVAQHLLIRGPRGMGKSFFMKYLQINFNKDSVFKDCDFLLLPEEQNNINTPSDWIRLVLSQLRGESGAAVTSLWEEPQDVWNTQLQLLKGYLKEKLDKNEQYQLVVVIENLDEFLINIQGDKKNRKAYESRFRHVLERLRGLTIIGAVPRIESDQNGIDGNYGSRLFHIFKKCNLSRWSEEDYLNYFERRRKIKIEETGINFSMQQVRLMQAKLKALSQYTGGSPRMAVVLTNLLLEEDVISTANTLFGLIDDLTPYYQDLTKNIPKKSKILFDTLIRKGENLSQSELAKEVGATQSQISKAVAWLKDNGYIIGQKRQNSPAFSYQVADRIHVLYYQQREVHHNQNYTPIWLLSDFLVAFYQEDELLIHARQSLLEQPSRSANDLAKLYFISTGIFSKDNVPDIEDSEEWLKMVEEIPEVDKELKLAFERFNSYDKEDENYEVLIFEEINKIIKILDQLKNLDLIYKYVTDFILECIFVKIKNDLYEKVLLTMLSVVNKRSINSVKIISLFLTIFYKKKNRFDEIINLYFKYPTNGEEVYFITQLSIAYIMTNNWSKVESILCKHSENLQTICKNFSQSIFFISMISGTAKAFEVGNRLLNLIKQHSKDIDESVVLGSYFSTLVKRKVSPELYKDLCYEALSLFPKPETQVVIQAALQLSNYIESGKDAAFLETIHPDQAIAIKAIVAENNL